MKRAKWIIGLSIAGIMAFAGTTFAQNYGSFSTQPVRRPLNTAPAIGAIQYQREIADTNFIKSDNTNSFPINGRSNGTYGTNDGYGMMGGYGANGTGGGYYGMMGGYGANSSGGSYYGMMGGGYNAQNLGVNLTDNIISNSDQALAIAKAYTQKVDQNVVAAELHEFSYGYEAELQDAKTGAKAYEIIIYKKGGQITNEMGPNIMWNTKYGHMNWGSTGALTVSEEQAAKSAQDFLSKMGEGYAIGKPELAPGYYEFMVQKDGKDYTELDVNGYTGQVWLENWQGPILNTIEVK